MKIELVSMGWLPYVRRGMRKAGIRLTVRWGKVYTVMATETRQPDSAAQLRAREVLAQASEAAKKELADPERRLYWTMNAAEMGYKTVRGGVCGVSCAEAERRGADGEDGDGKRGV